MARIFSVGTMAPSSDTTKAPSSISSAACGSISTKAWLALRLPSASTSTRPASIGASTKTSPVSSFVSPAADSVSSCWAGAPSAAALSVAPSFSFASASVSEGVSVRAAASLSSAAAGAAGASAILSSAAASFSLASSSSSDFTSSIVTERVDTAPLTSRSICMPMRSVSKRPSGVSTESRPCTNSASNLPSLSRTILAMPPRIPTVASPASNFTCPARLDKTPPINRIEPFSMRAPKLPLNCAGSKTKSSTIMRDDGPIFMLEPSTKSTCVRPRRPVSINTSSSTFSPTVMVFMASCVSPITACGMTAAVTPTLMRACAVPMNGA